MLIYHTYPKFNNRIQNTLCYDRVELRGMSLVLTFRYDLFFVYRRLIMKKIIYTEVLDFGQYVTSAFIGKSLKDPVLYLQDPDTKHYTAVKEGITEVLPEEDAVTLKFCPFDAEIPFQVRDGKQIVLRSTDVEMQVKGLDQFEACEENGVIYRLYTPDFEGPHPLVLFLHGGGECGTDNLVQMTGTIGAIHFAERWPDMVIMAPQAPLYDIPLSVKPAFKVDTSARPESGKYDRGWNRDYLGRILVIIRRLISEGVVDKDRVYVTGLSMGGAGTIRIVSMAPEIFAAAAPVCPSINGETLPMLQNWPDVPVWISTAYIDHQIDRHAYITNTVVSLLEKGKKDIHLTLYTSDELEKYHISQNPELTWAQRVGINHRSWILTYHNEKGILEWLVSHNKQR